MSTGVGLVTGAGRGMGRACARRLAEDFDPIVLVDRDPEGLQSAAEEIAGRAKVVPVVMDVTDPAAIAALVETIGGLGALRAVAHAAGISPTMADWRRILEVDLVGTARLVDALAPAVVAGTVAVCFASMASQLLVANGDPAADAVLDDPLHPDLAARLHATVGDAIEDSGIAYAWAKRGVQRLVRREALRWGPRGGRICSVSPGMIDTPQGRQEASQQPLMAVLLERTPLRREGRPEEVAALVAFLVSADASFITGCDILVDGGVCAAVAGTPRDEWSRDEASGDTIDERHVRPSDQ